MNGMETSIRLFMAGYIILRFYHLALFQSENIHFIAANHSDFCGILNIVCMMGDVDKIGPRAKMKTACDATLSFAIWL